MRKLTQRELRNNSGEIMRELDRGESFLVTSNGKPVGELQPVRPRQFVSTAALQEAMRGAGTVDYQELRTDIDAIVDQDPTPRAWPDD